MGDPDTLFSILWSTDPSGRTAIWVVLGAALLAALTIYAPVGLRLARLFLLERRLRAAVGEAEQGPHHDALRQVAQGSPIEAAFAEFDRRWSTAQLAEREDRAPIRLIDVFEDKPLLPYGPRRSLLPALPGIFLGIGVLAALLGLIPSLTSLAADETSQQAQAAWMALQLGQALRATAWGFLCGLGAGFASRLLEGGFHARASALDEIVERAFGSVSPGELAEITRQTQQRSLETLGKELTGFADELNERLDRGLQRIEQSTSRAANLVSQEQRGALHTVVQELSLSVRQGVENHLGELRGALQRAIDHQGSVTNGLAETFEQMVENAKTQDRVARTLVESANAVDEAAQSMRGTASEMQPVLDHLDATSRSLSETAEHVGDSQQVIARTAEGVRGSLEHAASGVDEQRRFIERSLAEIRRALVGLGDGLGDSLQRSLREVDDALSSTVGQLRDTLAESNETIERLAGPIRAAEGTTHETHVALDRVRNEVEALGQWLSQALKPLRSGLGDVENRAEDITRALGEFSNQTRQIDKTMASLREEIQEESRRLQGAGSELGRRLAQTTDAVGMLESTTSEAARRTRSGEGSMARERSWSAVRSPERFPETEPKRGPSRFERAPRSTPAATSEAPSARASSPDAPSLEHESTRSLSPPENEDKEMNESTARDLPDTSYRLGMPRAQGPDPYSRFDEADPGSSGRHSPNPDRELGDELKLSELLGRSDDDRAGGVRDGESD